jgi:predicted CXXCH cytochrome family protein
VADRAAAAQPRGGNLSARRLWLVCAALAILAGLVGLATQWRHLGSPGASGTAASAGVNSAPQAVSANPPASQTAATAVPAYVPNAICLSCHAQESAQWQPSHHARAMAPAQPDTVQADFRGTRFNDRNGNVQFGVRDGRYTVRTEGPDGKPTDFEVAYTFGVAPLQQYLIPMPGGRLQPLQVAWDAPRARWFHLLPNEKAPPGDVLHWTGRYQTANTMCLSCHTTGFEKRYDARADTFASTWTEPNVSCQSCHGPGERHVNWAKARATGVQPSPSPSSDAMGLLVDFKREGAKGQVDVCAACHSRRTELTATPVPGQPKLDHYLPSLLTPGLYHPDGQQLDEVFVDGSFRQSRMYRMGVGCTDCHNAHTGKLKASGNAVCTQCHAPQANTRFPSAAGSFDAPAHHRHPAGSAGAQCVACHMPAKTYMRIQDRPDHSLRVPRPDVSARLGTPDACTSCHTKQSPQWAAERIAQWYGPGRRQEPHFGDILAAARAGRPGAAEAVAGLAADPKQPGIVRATALDLLRSEPRVGDTVRVEATRDPDPEMRAAAAASLEGLPPAARIHAGVPLLSDPIRAVRIAAARSLSALPPGRLDAAARPAFDAAVAEYIAAQSVSLDMSGARLNLAVLEQNLGRAESAEQHYLAALRIDPDFTPARANLAQLYGAMGRRTDAERVLKEGVARMPELGELHYSLGLVLAEDARLPEAAQSLRRAARLLPQRARVHYNLGLALQQLGERNEAEAALLRAQQLDPNDPSLAYALAVFNAQAGRMSKVQEWVSVLRNLSPNDPRLAHFAPRGSASR